MVRDREAALLSTLPRQSLTGCRVVYPAYWGAAQAAEGVGGPLWKSVDKKLKVYRLTHVSVQFDWIKPDLMHFFNLSWTRSDP